MQDTELPDVRLVRGGGQPLHHQLRTQLALQVRAGVLPGGSRLPTVRALALRLKLNRNTVQKVYAALHRAGLLVTRVGSGTVVAADRAELQMQMATRDQLKQVIASALAEGVLGNDLRLIFESVLAEALKFCDRRTAEIISTRRRFAGRASYSSHRID
jgi:DNA-binding transcriptional regulator YhcF (GntR family)